MQQTLILTSILITCFLGIGCNNQHTTERLSETQLTKIDSLSPLEITDGNRGSYSIKDFQSVFVEDSSYLDQLTIGCAAGFYKVLGSKYVIHLRPNIELDYNEIVELQIDSMSEEVGITLYIFDEGKASLINKCTDVKMVNATEPIKSLNVSTGELKIGKSDPTDYYGNEMPKMSFKIKRLSFFDPQTKDSIIVENDVLWKVLDRGIPG